MSSSPYGGTKHTRWARRTVDGCWYVLGGDYGDGGFGGGSGSNILWKATPGKPFTFVKLNEWVPAPGHKIPNRVDEAPWMYDSKRDRFLLFPYPRWDATYTSDCIVGHLMFYDPKTNIWSDLGTGSYTGPTPTNFDPNNNPQYDPNGHQYPINTAKWGFYDEVTDKYYIPQGDSSLMVLDAATLTMEWPIQGIGNAAPYTYYNQSFYTACLCFDRKRRSIVTVKSANNGDYTGDPNSFHLISVNIDTRIVSLIPSSGPPIDLANPLYIDFEALVHDEANDLYLLFGGCYEIGGNQGNLQATNDLRVLPANGGDWMKFLPTGIQPPRRFGQTMHFEPTLGQFFELGGITDGVNDLTQAPEMFFLTNNLARPTWRTSMVANTWAQVPASNTLSSIDPESDTSINPNGVGQLSPWHGVGGQHMVIDAWNSACYDDSTHTLYVGPAGGHGDYAGNERYKIRMSDASPAWNMFGRPTGAIGNTGILDDGNGASGAYFDGAPRSTHTYNYSVFVPGVGPVIARLPAVYRTADNVAKAFSINPSTGAFTLLADYSAVSGVSNVVTVGACCYDPSRHCIWMMHTGTCKLVKLDCATNVVTSYGTSDNHTAGINCLVYVASQDCLLMFGFGASGYLDYPSGFSMFNLTTYAQTALSYAGSFAPGFTLKSDTSISGIVWDENRQRFVMWHNATNRTQLSTLTPNGAFTNAWTAGTLTAGVANAVTPSPPAANGTYGRFALSPSYDGVFLLNAVGEQPYFYAFT